MNNIKLFHLLDQNVEQIVQQIKKSRRKKILEQLFTVYTGIGRFAFLSADTEINQILDKAGSRELSHDTTMLDAIANDPEIFKYIYGNQKLIHQFN